ncbi:hypothetical protein [Kineococcus xinjiangensis]|uniref:hypothetical protein n=1 Tax=Kineococcus xinjiangensis TaxID=512762 RepID=UPI0011B01D3C|nr:hypothetical protein [Kineococcus xinjiangensis]
MPTVQQVPYVVVEELSGPVVAQQVCAVLLQTVRPRIQRLHVEVHSDHRDDFDVLAMEAQIRLRMAGGAGVRHSNDTVRELADPEAHWLALLVYAGWCRYLAAFDEVGMRILTVRDAGSGISASLTPGEARSVQQQIAPLTLTPPQESDLAVLDERHRRHRQQREEKLRRVQEVAAAAARAHPGTDPQLEVLTGRGAASDPREAAAASLEGWTVTVRAEVVPEDPAEAAPAVAVGLGRITPLDGATALEERGDLPGHFCLSVEVQPAEEHGHARGWLQPGAAVLSDGDLLVVADAADGPAIDFGWPPLPPGQEFAGGACRADFPGWLITVVHAAAGTVHLSAPLNWKRRSSHADRPSDGTCHLTITLAPTARS